MDASKIKQDLEKARAASLKQLDDLRAKIDDCAAELDWLEAAPMPLADALAKIDMEVNKFTDSIGVKKFFYNHEINVPSVFETDIKLNHQMMDGGISFANGSVNIASILVPLLGAETVRRSLHDQARKMVDDIDYGPAMADRPGLKDEVRKRKHSLEVEEERLICAAEELGMDGFFRRPDVDPKIVLMTE
ncbi:hypothetical protein [Methylomonas sp. MgM2]